MQNDWAYQEMRGAKVWDPRCRKTLISACHVLAEHAEIAFSRALGSQRKAVSRIFHHETTSAHDLLAGHFRATSLRCQNHDFILVASDTTSCDFTSHKAVEGLGSISSLPHQKGFFVHSALALSCKGVPLGLLHQHSWVRESPSSSEEDALPDTRTFAEKESYKWVEALRGVEAALPPHQKALLIQDREADIFAFFAAPRREGLDLLVRATHPRRIAVTGVLQSPTLFKAVAAAPVLATKTVSLPARPGQKARQAHLTLRVFAVSLLAPHNGTAPPVPLYVVRASEETPPEGVKEPIEWVLLTTLVVSDAATALAVVGYYALRWRIERFHYVLKSGCRLERLQMETFVTLRKAVSLYSIVAWHLLHLMYLSREVPDAPPWEALSATERTVLERATGKPLHTMQEVVVAVARLAGFVPVPSAPDPGVKSLWLGFRKLHDLVAGFHLARHPPSRT